MRVLIGCEFTGTVRDAFIRHGHDAWSCDLLPSEHGGPHYQCDVREVLGLGWDMAVFHPPCTHLALCQARWLKDHFVKRKNKPPRWHDGAPKRAAQAEAVVLFRACLQAPIARIAVENPMSMASTLVTPKSQVIHPWQFGHPEQKTTWLWLKNLPELQPTENVYDHMMTLPKRERERIWSMAPSENRGQERSRFFSGFANAMAAQWGSLPPIVCRSRSRI